MDNLKVEGESGKTEVKGCDNNKHKKITNEQCLKIVKKHLQSEAFDLLSFSESPVSDKPIGFLGEHARLQVSVSHNQQISDLRFFIKSIPTDCPKHAEFVVNAGVFTKESTLYATLLRDLKRAQCNAENSQKEANSTSRNGSLTPCNEISKAWAPNFYLKTDESLVLEDLSVKGFRIVDVREPLDYDHVVVSLKTVARFHAASIIFEEKQAKSKSGKSLEESVKCEKQEEGKTKRKLNELFPDLSIETFFVETKGHPQNDNFECGMKCLMAIAELLKGYSEQEMEKIKKSLPEELRKAMDFVKPHQKYRNVVNHGDLWSNNILFRYEGDKVVEARLVDFQHSRYSPPAHDVMDLLHLTTKRKFREEHLEKFLSIYYETLQDELKHHSLDVETLLPWDVFRESCEYFREIALITACYWFQLITMPAPIATEMMSTPEALEHNFRVDRTEPAIKAFKTDKTYEDRLSEPLREMIERCVLKC